MNDKQFEKMMGAFDALGSKLETFSTQLETKPDTTTTTEPVVEPSKPAEQPVISTEQFSKLEQALTGMVGKLDSLTQTIEQFSAEKPGQRPGPLGGDDLPSLV